VAYLFDTDAISEVLKRRPNPEFLRWLSLVPREQQYASAVTMGELYRWAYRSPDRERHLHNLDERILSAMTIVPYDAAVARVYGNLHARLAAAHALLADADLQIAATAVFHGLSLVTGNLRHFERVPELAIDRTLADTRRR
jgi:predicted nucleic acid-binding protein